MAARINLNAIDRLVGFFSPKAGLQRAAYRNAFAAAQTGLGYEGGRSTRLRKTSRDARGPDLMIGESAAKVRNHVRHLERNFPLVRGTVRVMVRNIVGANGITVEPMPRKADGTVHNEFADQIMRVQQRWSRRPEVTGSMTWAMAQRKACASWLRDGDEFTQMLPGFIPGLRHGSPLPFSLELLEADLVPLDFEDPARNIRQGIQRNAWGQPTNYLFYKQHPQDGYALTTAADLKFVSADRILHLALRDRLHQTRGISLFVSVINAAEDIKDVNEYELIASKLAASLGVMITRADGTGESGPVISGEITTSDKGRDLLPMEAGLIFEGAPGETASVIDSKRPNSQLDPFLQAQIRHFAAGVDAGYSSISRNYNGTYSAQRQELVEVWESYKVLRSEFVGTLVMPVYENAVATAIASGVLELPGDIDPTTIYDADFRGPPMPWIDPEREVEAEKINVRAGFKSLTQVIRDRGGNPWEVIEQIAEERRFARENGVVLETDPANQLASPSVVPPKQKEPGNAE
jgi:lambda family phage portal protein